SAATAASATGMGPLFVRGAPVNQSRKCIDDNESLTVGKPPHTFTADRGPPARHRRSLQKMPLREQRLRVGRGYAARGLPAAGTARPRHPPAPPASPSPSASPAPRPTGRRD